ncbi:MAG: asparagine synthase-related protein [Legionella sp.]|nr:asparagine synthase-related protein [Legionella sp.]
MIYIKNASCFDEIKINSQLLFYTAKAQKAPFITSFEAALNPACYRNQFDAFAYVIINQKTQEFLLVRDHLGMQPLFYAYQAASKTLVFGETMPDVLAELNPKPAILDAEARGEFIEPRVYADQTLYQGIYRVEPGHMMHGKPNGELTKKVFWQLEQAGETLYYQDKREYLEHFSELMSNAIQDATHGFNHVAAEFSAGVDSTAVYLASTERGLNPTLFMHAATPDSRSAKSYNTGAEDKFYQHYQPNIHRIDADNFDPIAVFRQYSKYFAGPAPYIFEAFAHPLHAEVSKGKHDVLLSGFGGDQGVSGHVPLRFILPELLRNKAFSRAFEALSSHTLRRRLLQCIQYSHPITHRLIQSGQDLKAVVTNVWKSDSNKRLISVYPQQRDYFKTLREAEWQSLQGPASHEIRMRIESSSIVAKKMGFEYRYPLLHPKLLEFYLSLPLSEKRHEGAGRYLIRRYLARYLPASIFDDYQKKTGLNILPATMDLYKTKYSEGAYQEAFHGLPYPELVQDKLEHMTMVKSARAFMLKSWQADYRQIGL